LGNLFFYLSRGLCYIQNRKMDKILLQKIKKVLKKNGIKRAAVFGSYARGEEKKNSDIDLLVELGENASLFDLVDLESELKKTTGKKIDAITYNSIHHLLKDSILSNQIPVI
jgi:uncharacterized protein